MNLMSTDDDVFAPTDVRASARPSPTGGLLDAFRTLRTSLVHRAPDERLRSVLVTSAGEGEGKSLTSVSLARSFVALGRSVLLVDADLRAPTQHRNVGVPAPVTGLSTADLADPHDLSDCRVRIEEGFDLLPAGPPIEGSSERLSSRPLRTQLTQLMRGYDLVVVDTPPVGRLPDAAVLAELVDGVVFVVDAQRQDTALARRALRTLRQVDATLIGAVLNRQSSDHAPSYGYGYGLPAQRGRRRR